jgi:hypothetical protein
MSDAHHLYMAEACTVCGVALRGFTEISYSRRTQTVTPRGDRKIYRQKTHTVGVEETIQLTAEDIGVAPVVGAVGALAASGAQLAGGTEVGGTDLAIAAASVHVDSVEAGGLNQEGKPTLRISLSVNSSDGFTSGFTVTAPA